MAVKSSRYIAPIDGLRAIAVAAVILYHLGITWIPGGFLGVDLFFVISGYVITRLLLDSILSKGALDLREFYWARVRRLVPALLFMLSGTTFIVAAWKPDAIHRFLSDLPYVLTGSENWHLVGFTRITSRQSDAHLFCNIPGLSELKFSFMRSGP